MLFGAGLASSWHCVGMCGGFPVMLGNGEPSLVRQAVYNAARLNSLVFIGALSGAVGASAMHLGPIPLVERGLPIIAGVLMTVAGVEMLGFGPGVRVLRRLGIHNGLARLLRGALRSKSISAPVALGVFNAFLPCHLVYAFAAQAASTGSVLEGMQTMFWFGLGTIPAMLAVGHLGGRLPVAIGQVLPRAAGAAVAGFGVWTIGRAFLVNGAQHHVL